MMSTSQPIVRRATAEEVWPLRHAVLRAGLPFDTAKFDGDLDDTTRHFGAFDGHDILCCLSLFQSTWNKSDAWQLRGMATVATHQRQGFGQLLLMFEIVSFAFSCVICEKLSLHTFTPFKIIFFKTLLLSEEGPIVAIIFVFLIIKYKSMGLWL